MEFNAELEPMNCEESHVFTITYDVDPKEIPGNFLTKSGDTRRFFLFDLDEIKVYTNDKKLKYMNVQSTFKSNTNTPNRKYIISKLLADVVNRQSYIPNRAKDKFFGKVRSRMLIHDSALRLRRGNRNPMDKNKTNTFFNFNYNKTSLFFGFNIQCSKEACKKKCSFMKSCGRKFCQEHWSTLSYVTKKEPLVREKFTKAKKKEILEVQKATETVAEASTSKQGSMRKLDKFKKDNSDKKEKNNNKQVGQKVGLNHIKKNFDKKGKAKQIDVEEFSSEISAKLNDQRIGKQSRLYFTKEEIRYLQVNASTNLQDEDFYLEKLEFNRKDHSRHFNKKYTFSPRYYNPENLKFFEEWTDSENDELETIVEKMRKYLEVNKIYEIVKYIKYLYRQDSLVQTESTFLAMLKVLHGYYKGNSYEDSMY